MWSGDGGPEWRSRLLTVYLNIGGKAQEKLMQLEKANPRVRVKACPGQYIGLSNGNECLGAEDSVLKWAGVTSQTVPTEFGSRSIS